jgi:uncharacterized protein involved in cysteine biosynthesis
MFAVYIAISVVAALAFGYAAVLNFTHHTSVAESAERLGVPASWQLPLGLLLAAGSGGLIAGIILPAIGIAAASGLVLYFVCAAGAHIKAHDTYLPSWINWFAFFSLAIAAFVVRLLV